jgi:hypothetical protein
MTANNDIDTEWHNILFDVRRSVRYHDHRVGFLDRVRKFISFLTLLSGSGAIITALSSLGTASVITAAAIVAAVSTFDLIFDPAGYARLHNDLKRRFIQLEQQIVLVDMSHENLKGFVSSRLSIEGDEPPILRVLDVICHNELARAMGYDEEHQVHLSWLQRAFSNVIDLWPRGARVVN